MTYNELRDYIDKFDAAGMVNEPTVKALRAVVELHKPVKDDWIEYTTCKACRVEDDDYYSPEYPCPTIRTIEKELS